MTLRNIVLLTGLAIFLGGCVVAPYPHHHRGYDYERDYDSGYYYDDYRDTPSYEGYYYVRVIFIGTVPYYVEDDRRVRPIPPHLHDHFRKSPYRKRPIKGFSRDTEVREGYYVSRVIYLNDVPHYVEDDGHARPLPNQLHERFRHTPFNQGNGRDRNGPPANGRDQDRNGQPAFGRDRDRDEQPALGRDRNRDEQPALGRDRNRDEQPALNRDRNRDEQPALGRDRNRDEQPALGRDRNRDEQPALGRDRNRDGQPALGRTRDLNRYGSAPPQRDDRGFRQPALRNNDSGRSAPANAGDRRNGENSPPKSDGKKTPAGKKKPRGDDNDGDDGNSGKKDNRR